MNKADLEKLLATDGVADDERAQLMVLDNAMARNFEAMKADGGAKAIRDWEAARDALERYAASVRERRGAADGPVFASRIEVVKWLEAQGWKIKKSKLYQDAKSGLLRVRADGSVARADVDAYVVRAGLNRLADPLDTVDELHAEKSRKEIRSLELKNEKLEHEIARLRGDYLLRAEVETELAVKLQVLMSGLWRMLAIKSGEWIAAVGGDVKKHRVFEDLVREDLVDLFDAYGRMGEVEAVMDKDDAGT